MHLAKGARYTGAPGGPIVSKGAPLLLLWDPGLLQGAQLGWVVLVGASDASKERIWLLKASYASQEYNSLW